MTGNVETGTTTRTGWFTWLAQKTHPYFALDGGSGAHLFAALSQRNPYIRQANAPRHANLLIIAEPVSPK